MKHAAIILLSLVLSACGTVDLKSHMENRVTTTLPCDRGFFASLWGPFGFTAEIDAKDVALLPCAARNVPPIIVPAVTK